MAFSVISSTVQLSTFHSRTSKWLAREFQQEIRLTQKYSALKPLILVWEPPTWWRYSKNVSRSSNPRMPSSSVDMTLLACSANSSDVACSSFVLSSWNFVNSFRSSACSSNNLKGWERERWRNWLDTISITLGFDLNDKITQRAPDSSIPKTSNRHKCFMLHCRRSSLSGINKTGY